MPTPGHPKLTLRLHPRAFELLREKANADPTPGRQSGLAAYVRALLYDHVGFPGSDEWEAVEDDKPPD